MPVLQHLVDVYKRQMAYCYVTPDRAVLFIHTARVTPEAKAELEANGVTLAEYDSVLDLSLIHISRRRSQAPRSS